MEMWMKLKNLMGYDKSRQRVIILKYFQLYLEKKLGE